MCLSAASPALNLLYNREKEDGVVLGISTQSKENNSENRQNTPHKNVNKTLSINEI